MSSILDLSSCGYARGVLFELFTSNLGIDRVIGEPQVHYISRIHTHRFNYFKKLFGNSFEVPYKQFVSKFQKVVERIDLWGKRYADSKKAYLTKYNTDQWGKLSHEKKLGHTLFDCPSCKADQDLKLICKNYPLKSKSADR